MADDIVGSRLKAQIGYGDTADINNPASLLPGREVKRSAAAQKLIQACTVPTGDDGQTRKVPDQKYKTSRGMRSRNGEGGKVPASTGRSTG